MLGVYNPSEIVDCMLRFPISENSLENPVEYIFEVAEKQATFTQIKKRKN
jgi:hypothetical protein